MTLIGCMQRQSANKCGIVLVLLLWYVAIYYGDRHVTCIFGQDCCNVLENDATRPTCWFT